jgi:hypothetical protein
MEKVNLLSLTMKEELDFLREQKEPEDIIEHLERNEEVFSEVKELINCYNEGCIHLNHLCYRIIELTEDILEIPEHDTFNGFNL